MIWSWSFSAVNILATGLCFLIVADMSRFMAMGFDPDGFLWQPKLQMVVLYAFHLTLRNLGVAENFSLFGGILVPIGMVVLLILALVACVPLTTMISPLKARMHDRDIAAQIEIAAGRRAVRRPQRED